MRVRMMFGEPEILDAESVGQTDEIGDLGINFRRRQIARAFEMIGDADGEKSHVASDTVRAGSVSDGAVEEPSLTLPARTEPRCSMMAEDRVWLVRFLERLDLVGRQLQG